MKDTGFSKNTLLKNRKNLIEKGALTIKKRNINGGGYTSSIYKIIDSNIKKYTSKETVHNLVLDGSNFEPETVQKMNEGSSKFEPTLVQNLSHEVLGREVLGNEVLEREKAHTQKINNQENKLKEQAREIAALKLLLNGQREKTSPPGSALPPSPKSKQYLGAELTLKQYFQENPTEKHNLLNRLMYDEQQHGSLETEIEKMCEYNASHQGLLRDPISYIPKLLMPWLRRTKNYVLSNKLKNNQKLKSDGRKGKGAIIDSSKYDKYRKLAGADGLIRVGGLSPNA